MSSSPILSTIEHIKKQFYCAVPVREINWNDTFDKLDIEEQDNIINETVNSKLILQYPLKITYQKEFLKYFIDQLEKQVSVDISDLVYDAFGRLVALPDTNGEFYKHYRLPNDNVISLCEEINFISCGTTGLCTWTAALALADWSFQNSNLFSNKIILELGSGVGLTGLAISKHCLANKIYLSDCHEVVLKKLRKNVELNTDETIKNKIDVVDLPWEIVSDETCLKKGLNKIDILLMADVVYDSDLFENLSNAIIYFLANNKKCIGYIVCTERNAETLKTFLEILDEKNIQYVQLEDCLPKYFIWTHKTPVKIYKLYII